VLSSYSVPFRPRPDPVVVDGFSSDYMKIQLLDGDVCKAILRPSAAWVGWVILKLGAMHIKDFHTRSQWIDLVNLAHDITWSAKVGGRSVR